MSTRRKPPHGDPRKRGIVPQDRDGDGHNVVILEGPDGPVVERVCVLVARSFIGECPEGHRLEHVNGNLGDDRAVNLRYVPAGGGKAGE